MNIKEMRELAKEMILEGVDAADPEKLVNDNIATDDDIINICGKIFNRNDYDEVVVFGIGKASLAMVKGTKKIKPDDGMIITKKGTVYDKNESPVPVREAYHPYPEQANLDAAREMLSKLEKKKNVLIIFLVSGGGSALFISPVEGISISEMNELNKLLVKSGANIHQINAVRKHLSCVKGGRFAEFCSDKGDLVSLIISDVVGDDLSVIASGPTYPDSSKFQDAIEILKEYGLWERASKNIKDHLKRGVRGEIKDTPKRLDVSNFLIGNNMSALKGAKRIADEKEINSIILTSQNEGEARMVAKPYIGIAKEIQDTGNPTKHPAALIFGGEMTVTFESMDSESGKGGPNREFVLASAMEIIDRENIVVTSVDSDGIDGVDKSGAIADGNSIRRANLDPKEILARHDSQSFFDSIDDSIEFDSRTNVNDISVIIVEKNRVGYC
ncbi:MAG: glycerate kinase type-2 family protein [Thermoplasmatota archaeon]